MASTISHPDTRTNDAPTLLFFVGDGKKAAQQQLKSVPTSSHFCYDETFRHVLQPWRHDLSSPFFAMCNEVFGPYHDDAAKVLEPELTRIKAEEPEDASRWAKRKAAKKARRKANGVISD